MQPPDKLRDPGRPANWLNKLLDYVISCRIVEGVGYRVNQTTRGVMLEIQPAVPSQPGEAGVIKQFRVKSVSYDYLVCREFDGTTEGSTDIWVAKQPNLRRTGWDGVTVTYPLEDYPGRPASSASITYSYIAPTYRTATVTAGAAAIVEHQVVTPRYTIDAFSIFASQSENGTGVTGADWVELSPRSWSRIV